MEINVSFQGDLADQHKIPAYDGTKTLQGISRSMVMVSNFLVEGRVRHRNFNTVPMTFNMVAHRPGSFETVFEIAYNAAVYGGPVLAGGVAANLLTDLLKTVYRRVTGGEEVQVPDRVAALEAERAGDVAALVDAVEPSVRLGHNVINHGVININIGSAGPQVGEDLANLNRETKQYLWESVINNEIRSKIFSVGSFNANQGSGRAYDLEEGRSFPFELDRDIDRETLNCLLRSISSYSRQRRLGDNLRHMIAIQYTSVDTSDGRLKKIRVLKARDTLDEL